MSGTHDPDSAVSRARADLALSVLAVDPVGLGGLWLRARSGPARDRFVTALKRLPLPLRKLHPGIDDAQLFGSIDLGATLGAGAVVKAEGLLNRPAALVLTMAERCPRRLAAHLGSAVDRGTHPVIALDEGAEPDECPPAALTERLGLFVAIDGVSARDWPEFRADRARLTAARLAVGDIEMPDALARTLVQLAAAFGIASLRAPLQAIAAARALAALAGRGAVNDDDVRQAAELIYSHRATQVPDPGEDDAEEAPEQPRDASSEPQDQDEAGSEDETEIPAEMLIEAVKAALPPDVLAALAAGRANRQSAGAAGSGAVHKGNRRGRPLPSRPGRLDGQNRIDLVATLRAAAPWQPMRRKAAPSGHLVHIRPSDIRVRRYKETSDRVLVFVVDASGSLAMSRLAEAKGAVEILLSEAYARRDHVALIAFRGTGAELLLPPTRSLVQTKRRLAELPGGGGTPLAAGLRMAAETAHLAERRGMTPTVALLTDGRANITLEGTPGRAQAGEDADRMARLLRASGVPSLVIDTASRPQPALAALAASLDGPYIALPRADARRLSAAVSRALAD